MNHKYSLGIFIPAIALLLSCKQKEEIALLPDLARAEAVMYTHPDSALHILETMAMPTPSASKLQNATWCLLMTQARDKNYIEHTSDSLINIAYDYFMQQNDPRRKAMVLNYEGTIHLEAFADAEEATQYYLDASKEVDKTEDYQLGYLIYANLGNIYARRDISEYAMPAFIKAHDYAIKSQNKVYISSSLCYIARAYSLNENWDKAIEYYTKAYETVKTTDNKRLISGTANELSSIYSRTQKYTLAMQYAKEALQIREEEGITSEEVRLTIGDIYRKIGNIDSASYFLSEAALSDNIYTRCSAYQALSFLNQDLTKDYKKALEYGNKLRIYTDSIRKTEKDEKLIKVQERFNQGKIIDKSNQLQIEKDRAANNYMRGIVALLSLSIIIIYIYQQKLLQKGRTIVKDKEQIRTYIMKVHDNELIINRNENRIKELSAQMEANQEIQGQLEEQQTVLADIQQENNSLKQENISLQGNISQYSASLQEQDKTLDALKMMSKENQYLRNREKLLSYQLFKKTNAFRFLKEKPKNLELIQWEETYDMINDIHDGFAKRIKEQIPSLTDSELKLSCLIKLGLSIPEMAILIGISTTSISRNKQRLKARINAELDSPLGENQTLDLWLWEYR